MPELCRFYGIIIRMFWADHPPPHFHANAAAPAPEPEAPLPPQD